MKIDSIFIANVAEIAGFITRYMKDQEKKAEIFEDHCYCDRYSCSETDNRLLITPFPIEPNFFKDINRLLGFKNVLNLTPKKISESVCQAILKDEHLLSLIIKLIQKNPQIKVHAHGATRDFMALINFLRKKDLRFQTPELPLEPNLWTQAFFGSKAGFRQAASCLKNFPDTPQGSICTKRAEIIGWAKYFLKQGSGFVLKTNRGLSGAGLWIITKERLNQKPLEPFIDQILQSQPYWQDEPAIVEQYIEPNLKVGGGTPSVEFRINQKIEFLYNCSMRISDRGVFLGTEMGKETLSPNLAKKMSQAGKCYANLLKDCGYQGYFDLDFVCGQDHELYPVESNLRRTGGTHAFELAKKLLGKDFMQHFYLINVVKTPAPKLQNKSYQYVKKQLQALLYPIQGKKEGVVLTIINYLKKGQLGYIVIGPNKKRVLAIEQSLLKKINTSN